MRDRLLNIIIGFDQFLQVLAYLGNHPPDETISGVIGYKKHRGTMNFVEKGICWFLTKIHNKHCIESIDLEEWEKEL